MDLVNNISELLQKVTTVESEILIKNANQNILDYRKMVAILPSTVLEGSSKHIFDRYKKLLLQNCRNSIAILNDLSNFYGVELLYKGELGNSKEIDLFTADYLYSTLIYG